MSKVDYKTGRYSKALIDRIDGMVDEKEFDPYKAGKKLEASGEEMFDNNLYADDKEELTDEDIDEASNGMKIAAAVFICIAIIAATVLIISNIL